MTICKKCGNNMSIMFSELCSQCFRDKVDKGILVCKSVCCDNLTTFKSKYCIKCEGMFIIAKKRSRSIVKKIRNKVVMPKENFWKFLPKILEWKL